MFDIVTPMKTSDARVLQTAFPFCHEYLEFDNWIVITNDSHQDSNVIGNDHMVWIDENTLYDGLSYDRVKSIIEERGCSTIRAGWYFQQFLKIAYATVCKNDYYLIWDADLVPLNKLSFFNENMKPCFTMKTEFHKPYFDTINKLFPGMECRLQNSSYIAEHMLISTFFMKEMIKKIEGNLNLKGFSFFEKILYAVDVLDLTRSGFSEFETYGCFVDSHFHDAYAHRILRTCRMGNVLLDVSDKNTMNWVKHDYDIVAFENSMSKSVFKCFLVNHFTMSVCNFRCIYHFYRKYLLCVDIFLIRVRCFFSKLLRR